MKKLVLAALLTVISVNFAFADFIDRECSLIVEKFGRICRQEMQGGEKVSIAVVPFDCKSDDLKQRNIGLGMSELITGSLVKYEGNIFTVIERGQLEKILNEQKLLLSGFTEENTGKIGELLGSKYIVSGNIEKRGDNYRVNCRLISSESGKVLASHISEFAIDEFEGKAKNYIIPRRESIGISIGWRIVPVTAIPSGTITVANGDKFSDIKLKSETLSYFQFGARFYAIDNLMLEISFCSMNYSYEYNYVSNSGGDSRDWENTSGLTDIIVTMNWVQPVTPDFDLYAGIGMNYFSLIGTDFTKTFPLAAFGFEYRFGQNMGLGCSGFYRFNKDIASIFDLCGNQITATPFFELNNISITPYISFYF